MTTTLPIGWVLRASTVGFTVGCSISHPNLPAFGDLVKVPLPNEDTNIFGLIYDVQIRDDPAVRQLILVGDLEQEAILDQRENRLVPIEISVLVVGYQQDKDVIYQGLPPRPPLSLDMLILCNNTDLRAFSRHLDYLRLVLNAAQIPADEVIITHLRRAAQAHAPEYQHDFLIGAGKELARLLNADLVRLDSILRRIKP